MSRKKYVLIGLVFGFIGAMVTKSLLSVNNTYAGDEKSAVAVIDPVYKENVIRSWPWYINHADPYSEKNGAVKPVPADLRKRIWEFDPKNPDYNADDLNYRERHVPYDSGYDDAIYECEQRIASGGSDASTAWVTARDIRINSKGFSWLNKQAIPARRRAHPERTILIRKIGPKIWFADLAYAAQTDDMVRSDEPFPGGEIQINRWVNSLLEKEK